MRLLRAIDMTFHQFEGSSIPPYAILSHRWEGEEVTYQEMSDWAAATGTRFRFANEQEVKIRMAATERKCGFQKIQKCCEQALEDMIEYVWVDTCCIDKSSSAELSEANNSMYAWYQQSVVCYAYLADVHTWPTYKTEDADGAWAGTVDVCDYLAGNGGALRSPWKTPGEDVAMQRLEPIARVMSSNWWTRGWTLQELIAPSEIVFYANNSAGWSKIGDRHTLLDLVAKRTGIEHRILLGGDVMQCSVAQRMSWASERETTRIEDLAYCLLGIFGVNMPLLYGEGSKAFLRLQEEIMKHSDDQTLFAWGLGFENTGDDLCGPLATHPCKFRGASNLMPIFDDDLQSPYSMTNKGLRIELPIVHQDEGPDALAILHCGTYNTRCLLPVSRLGPPGTNRYARKTSSTEPLMTIEGEDRTPTIIFMIQEPSTRVGKRRPLRVVISEGIRGLFDGVYCSDCCGLTPLHSGEGVPSEAIASTYQFPVSCRRGAVLLTNDYYSNLLLAFNIELQHVGRYACKVIYAGDDKDNLTVEEERIHNMAYTVRDTYSQQQVLCSLNKVGPWKVRTGKWIEKAVASEIKKEPSWSLNHSGSGPPNNRTSFVDLPLSRRILAKFAPYDELDSRDDGNLVLHLDLLDQSEGPQELYELE